MTKDEMFAMLDAHIGGIGVPLALKRPEFMLQVCNLVEEMTRKAEQEKARVERDQLFTKADRWRRERDELAVKLDRLSEPVEAGTGQTRPSQGICTELCRLRDRLHILEAENKLLRGRQADLEGREPSGWVVSWNNRESWHRTPYPRDMDIGKAREAGVEPKVTAMFDRPQLAAEAPRRRIPPCSGHAFEPGDPE